MSYGHAEKILADGRKSPVPELAQATAKLKLWADLNPGLVSLYLDFEACLRDVEEFVRGGKGR
jgi:hypothetical protein